MTDANTRDADGRELPQDLAAWIDEHDADLAVVDADDHDGTGGGYLAIVTAPSEVLSEQRDEHEPDDRDANAAVGEIVNNTGDDGGAASG